MMTGIQGDPPWSDFTRLLREHFDATHANVIFRHPALELNFITESYGPGFAGRDSCTACSACPDAKRCWPAFSRAA